MSRSHGYKTVTVARLLVTRAAAAYAGWRGCACRFDCLCSL